MGAPIVMGDIVIYSCLVTDETFHICSDHPFLLKVVEQVNFLVFVQLQMLQHRSHDELSSLDHMDVIPGNNTRIYHTIS